MIQGKHLTLHLPEWQNQLAKAIKDPKQLLDALDLPLEHLTSMQHAHQLFPLRVTHSYLSRIEPGNINDPLLRQVFPLPEETLLTENYYLDPVGDKQAELTPGLLHKYKNRVLLTLTAACAIHCRYCFRRHFDYTASNATKHWQKNIAYISQNTQIDEVIFSGGDPLSLNDHRLATMANELACIPHIKTLRIHTRQVIVLPTRVNESLLNWIKACQLKLIFVIHINHPNEIDVDVECALKQLYLAGVTLLNQAVLLKGVNDSADTLCQLSRKLFANNVLPYYLHQLDKVQGAAHFDTPKQRALNLMKEIRAELPGYLVPTLVQDLPSSPNKMPIT